MGYPERLLSNDEKIVAQFRPHWSRLIKEGLIALLGIALMIMALVLEWPPWVYLLVLVAIISFTARGVVRWATTHHVITNERLIYRAGWIAKRGKEIPLEVINDVTFNQTIFERIFKTGDLLIESAGTHGQTRYSDIPRPEDVQSIIYSVREPRKLQMESGIPPSLPHPSAPTSSHTSESVASQLDTLSRLLDQGKITNEEFQAEKTRLLGGD